MRMEVRTARLINIHEHGAAVFARHLPEDCEEIWLGVGSLPLEWARGLVCSAERKLQGATYHIAFREPCAPGILDAAQGWVSDSPDFLETCAFLRVFA